MCQIKKILFLSFFSFYGSYNLFVAEGNEQEEDLKNIDLSKLEELFNDEEMKKIFGDSNILKFLEGKQLSKNYFYSTNIGLGIHNNFTDVGHKFQNWHNSHFRYKTTKEAIKEALIYNCGGSHGKENNSYPKDYSGFYEYFNFIQSFHSNSIYINPTWNFQLRKSNFFAHVGIFLEKNTTQYSYNYVIAEEKEKEENNSKEININKVEEEAEDDDGFTRTSAKINLGFYSIKTGISFGFTWYSNKIYPWSAWHIDCMFSFGLQFAYSKDFDFAFYKYDTNNGQGINYFYFEKDLKNQNNPNKIYQKLDINPKYPSPIYGLFQISAGYNKFSIWFRIYTPLYWIKKIEDPLLFMFDEEMGQTVEYKDIKVRVIKCNNFGLQLSNLNFAFGFSYIF